MKQWNFVLSHGFRFFDLAVRLRPWAIDFPAVQPGNGLAGRILRRSEAVSFTDRSSGEVRLFRGIRLKYC